MFDKVIAARAMAIGVRVPSWMIPDPSRMRSVRAARYPSADGASDPHASATQQMSSPSFSASRTNSTVCAQSPPDASIVVAVRITPPSPSPAAVPITRRRRPHHSAAGLTRPPPPRPAA